VTTSSASQWRQVEAILERLEAALLLGPLTDVEAKAWAAEIERTRRGDVSTTPQALRHRDELLCACAYQFFPTFSASEQARRIADGLRTYYSTAWCRDRGKLECPPRLRGRPQEFFFAVLSVAPMLISERTIRRALVDTGHLGVAMANVPPHVRSLT
jgi:hypothetical protein